MSGNLLLTDEDIVLTLLSNLPKFSSFSKSNLEDFIHAGQAKVIEAGDVVINEEEYDSRVFLLLYGKLEISKNDKSIGYLQRTGEIFGEMGVIDASPRSATITAIEDSFLLIFDASKIDEKLKYDEIGFCYVLYRLFSEVLAHRLRETTLENIELKKTLAS